MTVKCEQCPARTATKVYRLDETTWRPVFKRLCPKCATARGFVKVDLTRGPYAGTGSRPEA